LVAFGRITLHQRLVKHVSYIRGCDPVLVWAVERRHEQLDFSVGRSRCDIQEEANASGVLILDPYITPSSHSIHWWRMKSFIGSILDGYYNDFFLLVGFYHSFGSGYYNNNTMRLPSIILFS